MRVAGRKTLEFGAVASEWADRNDEAIRDQFVVALDALGVVPVLALDHRPIRRRDRRAVEAEGGGRGARNHVAPRVRRPPAPVPYLLARERGAIRTSQLALSRRAVGERSGSKPRDERDGGDRNKNGVSSGPPPSRCSSTAPTGPVRQKHNPRANTRDGFSLAFSHRRRDRADGADPSAPRAMGFAPAVEALSGRGQQRSRSAIRSSRNSGDHVRHDSSSRRSGSNVTCPSVQWCVAG